jgi:hypothetical protein
MSCNSYDCCDTDSGSDCESSCESSCKRCRKAPCCCNSYPPKKNNKCRKYNTCNKPCKNYPDGTNILPEHIFVPGDYDNINEALTSLNSVKAGYVIHLANGVHTILTDHNSDVNYLRFEGDVNYTKGVGYIQGLGQWSAQGTGAPAGFLDDNQYNSDIGGLGPWTLTVENDREINVLGVDKNPDYSSLGKGDCLIFYHKDGTFTNHRICKGVGNCIMLKDCLCLQNDTVLKGEGFFIKPNVTIKTCASHRVTVQGRLEYAGIHFDTEENFVTGATGGFTEISYSTNNGNLNMKGIADWYKPNVHYGNRLKRGQLMTVDGSQGVYRYQSHIGHTSRSIFAANPFSQYADAIFTGCEVGSEVTNGGAVDHKFSDFCDCSDHGVKASNSGTVHTRGARFLNCLTGIKVESKSQHANYASGSERMVATTFIGNGTAMHYKTSTVGQHDEIILQGNGVDLTRDGVNIPVLTLPDSEVYGAQNSTIIFDKVTH